MFIVKEEVIEVGAPGISDVLHVYPERSIATLNGRPLPLNCREHRLLLQLAACEGTMVHQRVLIEAIYDPRSGKKASENLVRLVISRLRNKLHRATRGATQFIFCVQGQGYKLKAIPASEALQTLRRVA